MNNPQKNQRVRKAFIVGRPNSGKTSVFNALSGEMQKVGNWSGVTVSATKAQICCGVDKLELYDLPGCHSLLRFSQTPDDERIALDHLQSADEGTLLINVVNAANIRRDLYLSRQLMEIWRGPMLIVLNCMDLAIKKGIKIDVGVLSKEFGVEIIPMIARNSQGIEPLQKYLMTNACSKTNKAFT